MYYIEITLIFLNGANCDHLNILILNHYFCNMVLLILNFNLL